MHILVNLRLQGEPVDPSPEVVHVHQACGVGNLTRLLLRNDIEHVALNTITYFGNKRLVTQIEFRHVHVGNVFHQARIKVFPGLREERTL